MAAAWHFLVHHGLYDSVIAAVVLLAVTGLWAHLKLLPLWRAIADRLDTTTDGGLRDVIEAIQNTPPDRPGSER